jgi:chromosome segregation ATPase
MALIELHIHTHESENRIMALEKSLEEQQAVLKELQVNFEELKAKIPLIAESIQEEIKQAQDKFDIQDAIIKRLEVKVEELAATPNNEILVAQVTAETENLRQISDEMKTLIPNLNALASGVAGIIPDSASPDPLIPPLPTDVPPSPPVEESPAPMPVPEGIDPTTGLPFPG